MEGRKGQGQPHAQAEGTATCPGASLSPPYLPLHLPCPGDSI